jgi:hypothetical protein
MNNRQKGLFLYKLATTYGATAISDLKDPITGAIGKQGFTQEGVEGLISHATGNNAYAQGRPLPATLQALKNDPSAFNKVTTFLKNTPIQTSVLPDGTVHLVDGHHRAFLADQLGMQHLPSQNILNQNTTAQVLKNKPQTALPLPPKLLAVPSVNAAKNIAPFSMRSAVRLGGKWAVPAAIAGVAGKGLYNYFSNKK